MTESGGRNERRTTGRRRRPIPWAISDVVEIIDIAPYDGQEVPPTGNIRFENVAPHTASGSRRRRRGSGPEIVHERVWERPKAKSKSKASKEREEHTRIPRTETRFMEETTWDGNEKETTIVKETAYINPTITIAFTGDNKLGIKNKKKELRVTGLLAGVGSNEDIAVKKGSSGKMWFERRSRRPEIFPPIIPPVLPPSPPTSEN